MSESDTITISASELRPGSYIMLRNFPCRVTYVRLIEYTKVFVVGRDIFTRKMYEDLFSYEDFIPSYPVEETEYKVADINGNKLLLMDDNRKKRNDLHLDFSISSDQLDDIKKSTSDKIAYKYRKRLPAFYVATVISAFQTEKIISLRREQIYMPRDWFY